MMTSLASSCERKWRARHVPVITIGSIGPTESLKKELGWVSICKMLIDKQFYIMPHTFKGTAPPNQKLAYLVLYLKIIDTFLKTNTAWPS